MDRPYSEEGGESTGKQTLDWNPYGTRRKGRPEKTWERTILEEAWKCGETRSEFKELAGNSQMEMIHKCPVFLKERKHTAPSPPPRIFIADIWQWSVGNCYNFATEDLKTIWRGSATLNTAASYSEGPHFESVLQSVTS